MRLIGSETEYTLHQWANDWVTAFELKQPISPQRVKLDSDELVRMRADQDQALKAFEEQGSHHAGTFWKQWDIDRKGYIVPASRMK